MKYYTCGKGHWWYCEAHKELRSGHVCRHGNKRKCSSPLKYHGTTIQSGAKPTLLPSDQIKDAAVVVTNIFTGAQNAVQIDYTHYYQCTANGTKHFWKCAGRIDRPSSAACPKRMPPFNTPCGKPLETTVALVMEENHKPLDHSQFNQPVFVVHKFEQKASSSSLYEQPEERAPRKYESQSQSQLTAALLKGGIALLCRDGQFRTQPALATSNENQQEHVDEPGITQFGPLVANVSTTCTAVIGRLEIKKHAAQSYIVNPYIAGTVTYPDFTVEQNGQKYAVELKTPNTATMTQYINGSFYKESSVWGRPVEQEIENRAAILPDDYLQMLAFDLANLLESFQESVAALQKEIREGEHQTFWVKIKGFLFIDDKRAVKSYSKDQFLALYSKQTTLGFVATPSLIVNTTTTTTNNNQQETL